MRQPDPPPSLGLSLLGPPRVERDGTPVTVPTRKATALLAYLAVTGRPHHREALATLFWPEYDQARALANLRRTLWALKNAIDGEWLAIDAETLALAAEPGFWLDVEAFRGRLGVCAGERQSAAGAEAAGYDPREVCATCLPSFAAAVELYQDDFMAGFTLPDSPGFDEWQFFEREGLRAELAAALQRLARCYAGVQNLEPAIGYARRWLALDPLHEPAHRELMRLYAWDGQRAAALRQYHECARVLDAELGVAPEPATLALYQAIQTRQLAPLPREMEATVTPSEALLEATPPHNLPTQPTPFVGRQPELAELARLLSDSDCRLLTLTGPGGVGKSRLALEAAAGLLALSSETDGLAPFGPNFPNGIYWVPLAPLCSADAIVPTIAGALGSSFYPREGEDARQQLLNYLREKRLLLILDGFEQLVDSASLLAEMLAQAPGLKLLVTSRERLSLQPEWLFEVRGLPYPIDEPVESPEAYGAVELFMRRARQALSGFSVSEDEVPHLLRICRLVEGLPLGIELSAAWVTTLTTREIATEIARSLDFLSTTMHDVPPRHRSLRAVCDRSWDRLSEQEQEVFKRLSVFRGGFRREAAALVAGAGLSSLSALVSKSLVRRTQSGRYEVHDVLRQYAAERLAADPEEEAETLARHSSTYASFLQSRAAALQGPGQLEALEEINADLQNVRVAWRWATAEGRVQDVRTASPGLWLFYEIRSLFDEGASVFARAVAMLESQAGGEPPVGVTLGAALAYQARFCALRLDHATVGVLLRRSLALLRELGTEADLAKALSFAFDPGVVGSAAEAEPLLHESVAIHEKLGDRWQVAYSLLQFCRSVFVNWPGQVEPQPYLRRSHAIFLELGDRRGVALTMRRPPVGNGDAAGQEETLRRLAESIDVLRETGDGQMLQFWLDELGFRSREMGQVEEARRLHLESLQIAGEIGDRLGVAGSLDNLGLVALDQGDLEAAERYLEDGLAIRLELNRQWETAWSLQHLGDVAMARGDYARALTLYREGMDRGQDFDWMGMRSLSRMGSALYALGDSRQARKHLRAALELETAGFEEQLWATQETLIAAARLAAGQGAVEEAAAWLAAVMGQASVCVRRRDMAQRLLDELAASLSLEAMAAARARYADSPLGEVVRAALQVL